jgi:transposase
MIPVPSGFRVWLAVGHTDMRRGMNGLGLQVQEAMKRDPHAEISMSSEAVAAIS